MGYAGKTTQQIDTQNFGGINAKATALNIGDNQAADITNFDIGVDGALTKRYGYNVLHAPGTPYQHVGGYYRQDAGFVGNFVYGIIANNKYYESLTGNSGFTNRTGAVSISSSSTRPFVSQGWKGKLFITNGTINPIMCPPGQDAVYMQDASLMQNVTVLTVTRNGAAAAGNAYWVYITKITSRGETHWDQGFAFNLGNTVPGATDNYTITMAADSTASAYKVYLSGNGISTTQPPAQSSFTRVFGTISSSTTSLTINSSPFATVAPPSSNTAYNTPNDWNVNGYPWGFAVLNKGTTERLCAWRGNTLWFSSLALPLVWLDSSAFTYGLTGGRSDQITAVTSLFDYTVVFTNTDCFLFTGGSSSDFTLNKIIPVGCVGPNAWARVGADLYFWSQYGPTSLQRILSGADVAANSDFSIPVQPLVFNSGRTYWPLISAWYDVANTRLYFSYPTAANSTTNDGCLVYTVPTKSWTRYTGWNVVNALVDSTNTIYGMTSNGYAQLHTGTTDNGSTFTATYQTGWYDMRTWETKKRMVWVDVVADRSGGNYTFNFIPSFDYGYYTATAVTCTQTTTGGDTIETTSSTTTQHRIFTDGTGRSFQLQFSASTPYCKILGWRPEIRLKGVR